MKSRLVLVLVMMAGLVGCRFPAIAPQTPLADAPGAVSQQQPAPALQGRVDFGTRVQAGIPDVVSGATVSLINIGAAQTVSTALTDAQGNFVLNFANGYVADPTATYYLEAVKGLGSHAPGKDALRVRTIIRYANGWTSLTNTTPNAGIVVNPSSTALAVAAGLRNGKPTPVDFAQFIGALSGSGHDVYAPATGVSAGDYTDVLALVNDCLAGDQDPVAGIGLDLDKGWQALGQAMGPTLRIAGITSPLSKSGPAGTPVTLEGAGFDPTASNNRVAFNGIETPATTATSTQLTVTVPLGATSGQLTVQVAQLVALGPTFTVPVEVSGFSPASGRAGTSVIVTGSGFSPKLWENAVTFAGVPGTVTRATPTELTVTVPATQTGALAVTVSGQSATAGTFVYESPMLAAVTPSVERTGRVITLEGNFGPTAVVNFPGGVSVPASGTANRLTVTVPEGVTTGDLTVTTDGVTTNPRPFHRTASLGAELFTRWLPQTSYARALPKLSTARIYLTAEVIGNRVYVIGGSNGTAPLSSVEVARIDADGSLSGFSSAGVTLLTAREQHASVVIGNYLYVLGGRAGSALASIERAPIQADGSLGAFEQAGSLTTPREGLTVFVAGNRLHVVGGKNTTPLSSVESAIIRADGSLEAFRDAGVSLAAARSGHTVHVLRDHAYIVAGTGASGGLGSVERAPILSDGRLGAFQTLGASLGLPRGNHHSLLLGDTLTVFGGNIARPKAERATIKPDGSMGAFEVLPQAFSSDFCKGSGQVIVGNAAYLLGGSESTGSPSMAIWRAPIDVNLAGTPPRFESLGYTNLPVFRKNAPSAIVGDSLYVFGGLDADMRGIKSVLRARIQPDGTLGTLETIPTAVAFGTDREAVTVLDGQVYLRVGQRVARTAQGLDLGAPSFSTGYTTLTTREYPTTVQLDDRFYVVGGSGSDPNTERATIQDGSLLPFGTGSRLSQLRRRHVTAIVGNHLYAMGGDFPNSEFVERALITSSGVTHSIGSFATILTGTTTMGQPDHVTFNPIHPVTLIGNALYDFSDGNSGTVKRLRIDAQGNVAWPEQVPFRFLASDSKTACHQTGNVLHFVSERGIESVRIR